VKTNLMIFLKPTIVRGTQGGHEITSERYDYLRGEQSKSAPDARWFWNDPTAPELPAQGVMPGTPAAASTGATPVRIGPPGVRNEPRPAGH
jgi:general secretion pathway protein D